MKLTREFIHNVLQGKINLDFDEVIEEILENQEKAESFGILMKRGETKIIEENKRLKEKFQLMKSLVNSHDGSDYHARQLFDEIEETLEIEAGEVCNVRS